MTLLDNELIRKYFGCEAIECRELKAVKHDWLECLSYRVLNAMQEPIRKGERYLYASIDREGQFIEMQWGDDHSQAIEGYHPLHLRLPDRFQKKECEHSWMKRTGEECWRCGVIKCDATGTWCHCGQHKPAPEPSPCACWPNHSYQVGPSDGCETHCPCDCHGPSKHVPKSWRCPICKNQICPPGGHPQTGQPPEPEIPQPWKALIDSKPEKCGCGLSGIWTECPVHKPPTMVEEKIREIYAYHHDGHVLKETASLNQRLRELVKLAMEGR